MTGKDGYGGVDGEDRGESERLSICCYFRVTPMDDTLTVLGDETAAQHAPRFTVCRKGHCDHSTLEIVPST